jgi:hypothetical protein
MRLHAWGWRLSDALSQAVLCISTDTAAGRTRRPLLERAG